MEIRASLRFDTEIDGAPILAPKARVRVGYRGRWSMPVDGLVDTGSPVTLISSSFARDLGYPVDEARQRESIDFDVAGQTITAFKADLDIAFLQPGSNEIGASLVLHESIVFLSDGDPIFLLGQHDALERLAFEHRNQSPSFDFVLREAP